MLLFTLILLFKLGESVEVLCLEEQANIWCDVAHALAPGGATNFPGKSGFNASSPWVLSGSETATFSGVSSLGRPPLVFGAFPMIFLIDDASVSLAAGANFTLDGMVVVCDRARFEARSAHLRLEQSRKFETFWWSSGNASIVLEDVALTTVSAALPAGVPGNLVLYMRQRSQLRIDNIASGRGNVFLDSLQVLLGEDAASSQNNSQIFEESYVARRASHSFSNFSFADVFFEACPGEALALDALPELCEIENLSAPDACFSPGQQPISFSLGPPDVAFQMDITDSRIFSWAVSTYSQSEATVSNVERKANFGVGLGGHLSLDGAAVDMFFRTGADAVATGYSSTRNIALNDVYVFVWHMWGTTDDGVGGVGVPPYTVNIVNGSSVGDVLGASNVTINIEDTVLSGGQMNSNGVLNPVVVSGGKVTYETRAVEGGYISFTNAVEITSENVFCDADALMSLYDTADPPQPILRDSQGTVLRAALADPALGEEVRVPFPAVKNITFVNVSLSTSGDTPGPLPPAVLSLVRRGTFENVSQELSFGTPNVLSFSVDIGKELVGELEGYYEIVLIFEADVGRGAGDRTGCRRTVILGDPDSINQSSSSFELHTIF